MIMCHISIHDDKKKHQWKDELSMASGRGSGRGRDVEDGRRRKSGRGKQEKKFDRRCIITSHIGDQKKNK